MYLVPVKKKSPIRFDKQYLIKYNGFFCVSFISEQDDDLWFENSNSDNDFVKLSEADKWCVIEDEEE